MSLLEPIDSVTMTVDDEYVGAVMTDLRAGAGRVVGTEPAEASGRTVVHAEVPQTEITRYAIDLRSVSHGTGTVHQVPARLRLHAGGAGQAAGQRVGASLTSGGSRP